MSMNNIGKEMKRKGRKGVGIFTISWGKMGLNDHKQRVKIGKLMNCANLCVDISRDMDSGTVKNWGSPLLCGWALQLQHYRKR